MDSNVRISLLASMNAGRLLIVCGAGLSMAPPSSLPSANVVSEDCFDKYKLETDPNIDENLRHNLENFAEHFAALNQLESVFIENLVPWQKFIRLPNPGHAAIADFLITRASVATLSSNYDTLIERVAVDYGHDFRVSLDGDEATVAAIRQGPLLKFHGCSSRDRYSTVWAPSQLEEEPIAGRIEKSKIWMAANVRQKDILVVGFWSDWNYLNRVIGEALEDVAPLSVTVFDPSPTNDLQIKAPNLWEIAHGDNVTFNHVQESGADALDELRHAFSQKYLRQVFDAGKQLFEQETGQIPGNDILTEIDIENDALYGWRRDAEGVPSNKPATLKEPNNTELLGYCHLLLRQAGAEQTQQGYRLADRSIRVLNGAGQALSTLRDKFVEPPAVISADVVIAVGAENLGMPGNWVRTGRQNDVMRPRASGTWYDLESGIAELGI